jgi:hypothetical protein
VIIAAVMENCAFSVKAPCSPLKLNLKTEAKYSSEMFVDVHRSYTQLNPQKIGIVSSNFNDSTGIFLILLPPAI